MMIGQIFRPPKRWELTLTVDAAEAAILRFNWRGGGERKRPETREELGARLAMLEEADRRGGQFAARNPATPNLAEQSEARIAPDESSGLGGRRKARPFGSRVRVLSTLLWRLRRAEA